MVWRVVVLAFVGQRVVCVMECGCVFIYVGAKWLGGWCVFACMSAGFCWLFKCGSVRVVKGVWILETQKKGKKSIPKGREAEVTSTVQERSHANNARLLCLACQLKTSLASQEHAYRRRFLFS